MAEKSAREQGMREESEGGACQPLLGDSAGRKGTYLVLLVYCGLGALLMADYVWGIATLVKRYQTFRVLWGHMSKPSLNWLRYTYYASMGLAAVGYFPSLAHMLAVAPTLPRSVVNRVCGFFAVFFFTELFWLPMCVSYLEKPNETLFLCIRFQLACSGLSAIAWAYSVLTIPSSAVEVSGRALQLASFAGTFYFAFHCAVLDGIIWPPMFHKA
mmetsp:Transcript_143177/g.202475  ORF Transcript_143177/g.202475 Transcript_143177/m.202475 type:complete len:214 (+) Transcript_143177:47-688(+)